MNKQQLASKKVLVVGMGTSPAVMTEMLGEGLR